MRWLFGGMLLLALAGCSRTAGLGNGEERIDPRERDIERELIRLAKQVTLARRDESGAELVYRFNQPKSVACLDAELVVDTLPENLAQGLFATPARYPAKLRFANATQFDDREADLRGLSIKVLDVPGAVSVAGGPGVQDFTFNNYPALFAGTPDDFLSFVQATADGQTWRYFLRHPRSLLIVLRARSRPDSPFVLRYHSTTPYRFGARSDTAVKLAVQACDALPALPRVDDPHYLRDAVATTLRNGSVCLAFMVQFQADPNSMPIEDASVIWPEEQSPFQKVAEIRIPPQEFADPAHRSACESLQFNPWNGLAEHRPLGGINRVRRDLYRELGELRARENAAVGR